MRVIENIHKGNLELSGDLEVLGIVEGTVTVPAGTFLTLKGIVTGNLIVSKNGSATVNGIVNGRVHNDGGNVRIFGIIGSLRDTGTPATVVEANAIIKSN